jgi:hypothetical protein
MLRIVGFVLRFMIVDLVLAVITRPAMATLESFIVGMI